MKSNKRKCAVIGCGSVGAATAYTLALCCSGLVSETVIIDIDRKKAASEAADISHSLPFAESSRMYIYGGDYSDIKDAGIVIITAGVPQKPGESRRSLTMRNLPIIRNICECIKEQNDDCIILMVTNPVDIMTYAAICYSGFSRHNVIGTGCVLDSARMKYELGHHFGIDSKNVHMFIMGEHGDSEFPLWSGANISGINLLDYCRENDFTTDGGELDYIFAGVRDSAYKIIEGKGSTCYGIASAITRIVTAILRGENSILPVSVLLRGEYGIVGVALSVPCIIGESGIVDIMEMPLSANEKKRLVESASTLDEILSVTDLNNSKQAYNNGILV